MGKGRYSWIDLDGNVCEGAHWDDFPAEMDRVIAFVPDAPDPPHTQEEHEAMASFNAKFQEVLARCRR